MSRTYRTHRGYFQVYAHGYFWTWKEEWAFAKQLGWNYLGWKTAYTVDRKARDCKPWNKPPKWFKQQRRRLERAQVNNAMRNHKQIPLFKKSDEWDWT